MRSLFSLQLPYELQYTILTLVVANSIHSVCFANSEQLEESQELEWELETFRVLSLVSKSFRAVCLSLCARGLGGCDISDGDSPTAYASHRLSYLHKLGTSRIDSDDVDQLRASWNGLRRNFNPTLMGASSFNLFDCYILLVSFRRLRKSSSKSEMVEEFNKNQQLVISSAKVLSLTCHQATKHLGDVGGGLFIPLGDVADQELVLLDASTRIVNLFHIVENALRFLDVIWKAKERYGAELMSSMGIIDEGEEEACMDNIKFRLSVIYRSAVRYQEVLASFRESHMGHDVVLLHQLPGTLKILTKLTKPLVCSTIAKSELERCQHSQASTGSAESNKTSVFSLTEDEDASLDKSTSFRELVLVFCTLWMKSMADPRAIRDKRKETEEEQEYLTSSEEMLGDFVRREGLEDLSDDTEEVFLSAYGLSPPA
ncbi:hypothetical protein K435DRAFT_337978 [Dendrothele bispora CBS 962.96]|uniref:Uncharacterized protein n=1 Tax=Dendrothele bispora (strain CBS 962.96) TaxID=1314807 RepID=A0A4S8MIM0_DENBC|nr:hypothetical protein K435DRAFT_337978 [Dendrothele bispora CBS 962.96]